MSRIARTFLLRDGNDYPVFFFDAVENEYYIEFTVSKAQEDGMGQPYRDSSYFSLIIDKDGNGRIGTNGSVHLWGVGAWSLHTRLLVTLFAYANKHFKKHGVVWAYWYEESEASERLDLYELGFHTLDRGVI